MAKTFNVRLTGHNQYHDVTVKTKDERPMSWDDSGMGKFNLIDGTKFYFSAHNLVFIRDNESTSEALDMRSWLR